MSIHSSCCPYWRLLPIVIALWTSSGCRLWQVDSGFAGDPLSKETLAALTSLLQYDAWRENRDWRYWASAANSTNGPALGEIPRWTFSRKTKVANDNLGSTNEDGQSVDDVIDAAGPAVSNPAAVEQATAQVEPDTADKQAPPSDKMEQLAPLDESKTDAPSNSATEQASHYDDTLSEDETTATNSDSTKADDSIATDDSSPKSWDGFWPLDAPEMLDVLNGSRRSSSGDAEKRRSVGGDAYLARLARHDDLVGWNAAILWAHRDPVAAREIAPVFERLVAEPPPYDQTTKRELDDNQSESNDTPSQFNRNLKETRDRIFGNTSPADSGKTQDQSSPISPSMRAAAAEAWCLVLATEVSDPSETLAPAGRLLQRTNLPDVVRAELFRSIGRWVSPSVIPRMANAMRESDDEQRAPLEIRRAAIDTCLIFALANTPSAAPSRGEDAESATTSSFSTADWPTTIRACQYDPDARVRKTFGRWLAVSRHPDAVRLLKLQLADKEVRVRETALMSLGVLHTVEARTELHMQAKRSQPRVRMFAIKGLAHWGVSEIASFAGDSSFSVRQVVAEEAAHSADLESALLLQKLLVDSSGQVQATVVQSISGWPDELAIPLCLHGMRGGLVATRRSCFQQLRKRTNIDDVFPVDVPPKKRAEVVIQLVGEHNLPVAYWDQLRRVGLREHEQINERHIAEIHADLRAITTENAQSPAYVAAKARLMERSAADLPIVEKYLLQNSESEIAFLYRELLPSWSPVYETLQQLEESDVFVRRRSAQQLARIATDATLSPLAARRLRRKMAQEQDRLVWRYVMSAAMHDGTDESAQLALLAVNHTWPDIRLLGCEFIARHARPQYALWLMPLFHDRNKNVRLAAVQAAGHCRNPQIIEDSINPENGTLAGLRSVMTDSDQQLRFAAAVSLSQLGDGQGMQELIRMSYSQNAKIRIRVVEQMGLTGRSWFIDHMIQLAWTESNDSAKRAILRSLDQLVPMEKRPQGLADESSFDAKIKIWVTWQQERRGKAGPAQVATSRLSKSH